MAIPVVMPRQGQSVERCILTAWYKSAGEKVSRGDLLFAYETDKAAFEEEAPSDGILLACFFEAGEEIPVLTNVAVIGSEGELVDEFRPTGIIAGESTPLIGKALHKEGSALQDGEMENPRKDLLNGEGRFSISPRARKLAQEKRIGIDSISGSGPGGRIIERDIREEILKGRRLTPLAQKMVEMDGLTLPDEGQTAHGRIYSRDLAWNLSAPSNTESASGNYTDQPITNVRRIIASAMHRSLQNSAQLTHHLSADASRMLQLRKAVKERLKKDSAQNITLNDMVCYAVVRALKRHPGANAHLLEGKIRQFHVVNLGIAVDTDRGLLVPTLTRADELSLPGLSIRLGELAEASRRGSVSPDLLAPDSATFTVTNLGNYGVEMFTPVINLPQVGILGINTILQRPVELESGVIGFRPYLGLSLTYDHRALDGGPATRFLAEIRKQIENLSEELI